MTIPRRRVLALGATSGAIASAGCVSGLLRSGEDGPTENQEEDRRPLTLAKGSPGSLADSDEVHSGWVHVVAHGETYDLTFDVRSCHEPGREVTIDLHGIPGGEYDLGFATTEASKTGATTTEADADSDCAFGTRINGSGTLPLEFEKLRITADGRTVQTVEKEGTMAVMRPLPDPIDVRSDEAFADRA